jgi:hypothetical protein
MPKVNLIDCVELVMNDETCVVLKVKEEKRDDLFLINGFSGDESMIKVSKVCDVCSSISYRIRKTNGSSYSFSSNTLMCDEMRIMMHKINSTIINDIGIPLVSDNHSFYNYIQKIGDYKKKSHKFEIMGWGERDHEDNMVIHQNGNYIGRGGLDELIAKIQSKYKTTEVQFGHSPRTGCEIYTIVTIAE